MGQVEINRTKFDSQFRQIVAGEIRNAKNSIKIVTGEISAYDYLDLRNPAEEAARNGIQIEVYASGPNRNIINRLIYNGINVYTGKEVPNEHFMVIDDKRAIISYKQENRVIPTPMGDRMGMSTDNSDEVSRLLSSFESLKKSAMKETIHGQDPLETILDNNIRQE